MEMGEGVAVPLPAEPDKKRLEVRFEQEEAHCGDEVRLRASTENIADGIKVQFTLKQKGAAFESPKAALVAASARHPWITKARTDERPEPQFTLSGAADGQSADAEKPLDLEKYEDVAVETRTIACRSGRFGWTGKFDISLKAGVVHVTTRIKLLNRQGSKPTDAGAELPAVGDPVSDADKAAMRADIEGKLSLKNFLHRAGCKRGDGCDCPKPRGCCKFDVTIEVEFVESGEHHVVNLYQGPGRANASNWTRVKTRDNSWAHETGHLLGWYDEYPGAIGVPPRWKIQTPVVMNSGLTVPPEYYWDFRDWIDGRTAESWSALAV